jgi:hypothetical protein
VGEEIGWVFEGFELEVIGEKEELGIMTSARKGRGGVALPGTAWDEWRFLKEERSSLLEDLYLTRQEQDVLQDKIERRSGTLSVLETLEGDHSCQSSRRPRYHFIYGKSNGTILQYQRHQC